MGEIRKNLCLFKFHYLDKRYTLVMFKLVINSVHLVINTIQLVINSIQSCDGKLLEQVMIIKHSR